MGNEGASQSYLGIAALLFIGGVVGFMVGSAGSSPAGASSRNDPSSEAHLLKLEKSIAGMESAVERLSSRIDADATPGSASPSTPAAPAGLPRLHKAAELELRIQALGTEPPAQQLSELATEVDSWDITEKDEKSFDELKAKLLQRLRDRVVTEVKTESLAALEYKSRPDAADHQANAARILALYPMANDEQVSRTARDMAADLRKLAANLDSIRRQRYNSWAVGCVELAIAGYYKNKKSNVFLSEDEKKNLVESLATHLAEVDPQVLEPIVSDSYTYAMGLTKDSISEANKIELAKRLTSPQIRRKTLEDF